MASQQELAVRRAIRSSLADVTSGTVLVACSGGADSLALAWCAAAEARRAGLRAGGVTVDHGLQDGSAPRARSIAAGLVDWGLDPVEVVHAPVDSHGYGPEGDARKARYAALEGAAMRHDAKAVLLGHTRDDQAETVLLGLARGSGARSLGGMPPVAGRYRRPLLGLRRETVRAAVPPGAKPWEDPHNALPLYRRARVRHDVLPVLERELGPGVGDALARTAELLRADADALDEWADRVFAAASVPDAAGAGPSGTPVVVLDVQLLTDLPAAVRTRVLRRAALVAGSPPSDLSAAHVWAVDALVKAWHGQGPIDLPGRVRAARSGRPAKISFG
jgi:tRNA(Ile)-lysidine synthetase-like protein